MISWQRYPRLDLGPDDKPQSELRSDDGRFRIVGPVNEPGFVGYKLFESGLHVATVLRQKDAKTVAEERKSQG